MFFIAMCGGGAEIFRRGVAGRVGQRGGAHPK
jgi:hypothetical protein